MIPPYPIIDVTAWKPYRDEPMGSKRKVWLINGADRWLFKEPKQLGEDWAEKAAAEVAGLLELPHAHVELAVAHGRVGVLSKDFVSASPNLQLVHGNELMAELYPGYQATGTNWRLPQHTVDRVLKVLGQSFVHLPKGGNLPAAVTSPPELFCGYLMFDAFVGNTDRHHENWAVIDSQTSVGGHRYAELAPTFDHASCLGRELTDQVRHERMTTKDKNRTVDAYVLRMPSRLHRDEQTAKPIHPAEAFQITARAYPVAAQAWLERLAGISPQSLTDVLDAIPAERVTDASRRFALLMLESNRRKLLEGLKK